MKNANESRFYGFTLIELLVVVLIIGILTAVGIAQYQKAVDKSRYATLMPMAKNIHDAQEVFYMGRGDYSDDLSYLDTQLPGEPSGTSANFGDGITAEISSVDNYAYVKMSKEGLNNNYIIYQNRSLNFPGEIHCEALNDNTRANELCKNLGGQEIGGSLTGGYTTYVLEGSGTGMPYSLAQAAEAAGTNWQSCDTYPCTKECSRDVKAGFSCSGTYNEDKSYSERVCQGEVCVETEYDENGNKKRAATCQLNGDVCQEMRISTYDENGHAISQRWCNVYDSSGKCTQYLGADYTYDANGKMTSRRDCSAVDSSGNCTAYSSGMDYTYDANGNQTSQRSCSTFDSSGNCTRYSSGTDYTYDENGNKIAAHFCSIFSGTTCTKWGRYDFYNAESIR